MHYWILSLCIEVHFGDEHLHRPVRKWGDDKVSLMKCISMTLE